MKNYLMAAMALSTLGGMAACSHSGPQMSNQVLVQGGPDWVNKGSGAFGGDKGRVFYGVGIAGGIRNPSMRRSSADTRARGEISKIMNSYVTVLNKAWQESTTGGDMSASNEQQHVSETLKSFSQTELSGVQIVDHFVAADGTEYALAQLDMEGMKNNMEKMKDLNTKVRDAIKANADKAFDELSAEEAKHK